MLITNSRETNKKILKEYSQYAKKGEKRNHIQIKWLIKTSKVRKGVDDKSSKQEQYNK